MSQYLQYFILYCCALEHQHLWLLPCFVRAPCQKTVEGAKDDTESTIRMSERRLLLHTCGQVWPLNNTEESLGLYLKGKKILSLIIHTIKTLINVTFSIESFHSSSHFLVVLLYLVFTPPGAPFVN